MLFIRECSIKIRLSGCNSIYDVLETFKIIFHAVEPSGNFACLCRRKGIVRDCFADGFYKYLKTYFIVRGKAVGFRA